MDEYEQIKRLREALSFYADERRYRGANIRALIPNDPHQPADAAYLWDVSRDGGAIARKALDQ